MLNETQSSSQLTQQDIDLLAGYGQSRRYPKNSILVHKGDESTGVYLIKEGRVKVYDSDELGGEITFRYQGMGEFFGEMALLNQAPRSASIATVEDTQVIYINRDKFECCIADNPRFSSTLMSYFISRIANLSDQLASCALKNVYERVRDKLPELASETNGELILDHFYTHKDIAGLVGSGREMVSRIMKKLEKGGYIEKRKGQLVISKTLPRNLPG